MKTSVSYDRSKKQWVAQNGTPYADKDKRKVLLYALKHDHPELWKSAHGIACACSQDGNGKGIDLKLIDRLVKAAQLIAKGKVFDGFVLSQNGGGKTYQTTRLTLSSWSCECEDYQKGGIELQGYGTHCKHTLAQLLAYFTGAKLQPYNPAKPQFESVGDFLQGMSEEDADRICDPRYQKALLTGGDAVFQYFYEEILNKYAPQLYQNAYTMLRDDRDMLEEIRSLSGGAFFQIFEIRELDGERYGEFWPLLYEAANNGQLSNLKHDLINVFEQL